MADLSLRPITLAQAKDFVRQHHRHHQPSLSHKFSIGVMAGEELIGCIVVGRPVARGLDDGVTAEATRCCVREGYPNACSMLYGAAWRAAKAMGYRRIVTYTLESEEGASVRAAGWVPCATTQHKPNGWDVPGRRREVKAPTERKVRWEQGSHNTPTEETQK